MLKQSSPESEHVTRRNPEMEGYVKIQPVVMEGFPDAHNVFLQVANQRFQVDAFACETKEDAEWMRDMLCIALAKVRSDGFAQTPTWHEAAARWLTDKADLATNSLHCGDSSMTIHFTHKHAETLRALAKEIRALSDTTDRGGK